MTGQKKTRGKKPARRTSARKSAALVRQKREETLEEVEKSIRRLFVDARLARYRIGRHLATIRDRQLYRESGARTFTEYLMRLDGPSVRTLYAWVALADRVPQAVAEAFEPDRIELGLRLLRPKSPGEPTVVSVKALRRLRVTVVRDGEQVEVGFLEATIAELIDAVNLEGAGRRADALPPEVTKAVAAFEERFGAGEERLVEYRPVNRRGRTGVELFVPTEKLGEFLQRLR